MLSISPVRTCSSVIVEPETGPGPAGHSITVRTSAVEVLPPVAPCCSWMATNRPKPKTRGTDYLARTPSGSRPRPRADHEGARRPDPGVHAPAAARSRSRVRKAGHQAARCWYSRTWARLTGRAAGERGPVPGAGRRRARCAWANGWTNRHITRSFIATARAGLPGRAGPVRHRRDGPHRQPAAGEFSFTRALERFPLGNRPAGLANAPLLPPTGGSLPPGVSSKSNRHRGPASTTRTRCSWKAGTAGGPGWLVCTVPLDKSWVTNLPDPAGIPGAGPRVGECARRPSGRASTGPRSTEYKPATGASRSRYPPGERRKRPAA